jgi:hypothetical protein
VTSADEDTLVADVDAYVAAHGDEHDEHGHSHDEHDDSSHDDEASAVTTEHGSVLWREFARAATGVWGGCCVEFDADGVAQDIPLRYVHGVGRVPAQNMPFREQELDWMTKNTTESNDGGDGLVINTKRAMPTIGNEDAISSCGGAEWGEHVAFVEDEPLCILRGANEDKTVLPDGSFSAGSRFLRTESNATDAAHHCLAHPDDPDARTRVVHRVRRCEKENASGDDDTPLFRWRTESIEVWREQRGVNNGGPKCVAPFSNDAILAKSALVSDASRWRCVPESSAVYFLMWDDDEYATDATDADQKSFFTMLADAGEAENLVFLDGGDGGGDGDGDLNLSAAVSRCASSLETSVLLSLGFAVVAYALVGAAGYATFGDATRDNVLLNLGSPALDAAMAVYQAICFPPTFHSLRGVAYALVDGGDADFPGRGAHAARVFAMLAAAATVAATLPHSERIFAVTGAVGVAAVCYAFPVAMWVRVSGGGVGGGGVESPRARTDRTAPAAALAAGVALSALGLWAALEDEEG